jgi:hypothetical protein
MSVNNITRRFQELKDNRSFALVFRGPTWIQVGFGKPPLQRTRSDGQLSNQHASGVCSKNSIVDLSRQRSLRLLRCAKEKFLCVLRVLRDK